MQVDTLILERKLDEATTAMKLANESPDSVRKVELTYGDMMLIWELLGLRNSILNITGKQRK